MGTILRHILVLFVVILVIFIAATAAAPPQQSCGPNEAYVTCGSACPPTCGKDGPTFCTLQCIIGCQCKEGYLKNSAGACVTQDQC